MKSRITVITSSKPQRLTKEFSWKDGQLHKEGGGMLIEGQADILEIDGIGGLRTTLESLEPDQALVFGLPRNVSLGRWAGHHDA